MQRAAHRLFGDSPIPRYVQLAGLFRQRIARGVWPTGGTLPSLDKLVLEFDVARVTVRQAMTLLAREGLVSPQRGRGTAVIGSPGRDRWMRLETTLRELAEVYRDDRPKLTLIDEASASPHLEPGDGKPAPRYHFLRRVHSRGDEAYCVISIYLDERVFRLDPSGSEPKPSCRCCLSCRGCGSRPRARRSRSAQLTWRRHRSWGYR